MGSKSSRSPTKKLMNGRSRIVAELVDDLMFGAFPDVKSWEKTLYTTNLTSNSILFYLKYV